LQEMKMFSKFASRGVALMFATFATAIHAQTIVIGQTIDLSGATAEHGTAISRGARLVIDRVNATGGINGNKIELITLDDKGIADNAKANAIQLLDEAKAIALFSGVEGGPCVIQTTVATERKVPVIACAAGSPDLREPFNAYSFPVRAPHLLEFEKIIGHGVAMGRTRFALLHADSETGRKHLANVTRVLKKKNIDLALAIPLNKSFTAQTAMAAIAAAKIEVLMNHGAYKPIAEIYKASRTSYPALEIMAVNSGAQQLVRIVGESAKGIIFTQIVPFPWSPGFPIVREYQKAWMETYPNAELSFSSLEGFINAKVLVDALQRSKAFTRKGIFEAMENTRDLDLGGMRVRFGPEDRSGSQFVDTVIANRRGGFSN
jgi:branched-chain amino acid transport system substrate-binding protein